ncbi:UNVERIFIED_CONTAM: hypothetical protein FKN15_043065, partial [Acipenser sinensis]
LAKHAVNGNTMVEPFPEGMEKVIFGMGCFWGAERRFWRKSGVFSTQVGYAGGYTPNPNYKEVCSGMTGHTEVVRVVFDPQAVSYKELLKIFWESHNPTQEPCIWIVQELTKKGVGVISTEIREAPEFYYAEDYHQQYLHKVPNGYCRLKDIGVSCPMGLGKKEEL